MPSTDGIVVSFGTPAQYAFGAAVDTLCGVLAGSIARRGAPAG
jgi:GntR family transcriptional regulator/MocR family aminotransferase